MAVGLNILDFRGKGGRFAEGRRSLPYGWFGKGILKKKCAGKEAGFRTKRREKKEFAGQ